LFLWHKLPRDRASNRRRTVSGAAVRAVKAEAGVVMARQPLAAMARAEAAMHAAHKAPAALHKHHQLRK